MIKRAQETVWAGRPVKMRAKGQDGQMQVVLLGQAGAQPPAVPAA